jgi:hypothetical protein
MLDTGCWMLDTGCLMLDAGCWMLDAGYWMLDAGCWMLDAGYWILDAGYWILELSAKLQNFITFFIFVVGKKSIYVWYRHRTHIPFNFLHFLRSGF